MRRALKIAPVAAVQTDYSPFNRAIETDESDNLLAACREHGVTVVAAMPLNRGLLTPTFTSAEAAGKVNDMRTKMMPRFQEGNREKNMAIVEKFEALAAKLGYTMPQLSLAWLMKQGTDIVPIPGTKNLKYLEENWKALDIELSDKDEADVRQFLEASQVEGDVVPAAFKSWLYIDTAEEQ